jgi:hypothetical protein
MDNISVPIIDYSITALTKNFILSLLIITILTVPSMTLSKDTGAEYTALKNEMKERLRHLN